MIGTPISFISVLFNIIPPRTIKKAGLRIKDPSGQPPNIKKRKAKRGSALGLMNNPLFHHTKCPLPPIQKGARLYDKRLSERFVISKTGCILHHWVSEIPVIIMDHAQWAKKIYAQIKQAQTKIYCDHLLELIFMIEFPDGDLVFHVTKMSKGKILVEIYA